MRNRVMVCAMGVAVAALAGMVPARHLGAQGAVPSGNKLVYADFENAAPDGKPISARGGAVNIFTYQEQPTLPPKYKGPSLIRTSREDQNHAAMFEYELVTPNEYEGVVIDIQGQPAVDGVLPQDDVSGFKNMLIAAYATGTQYVRVEVRTVGDKVKQNDAYPIYNFKLQEGFHTYKVPLKAFALPAWVSDTRIDPKEVLKRLTSVTFSVYCEQTCRPTKGNAVVDGIIFEK